MSDGKPPDAARRRRTATNGTGVERINAIVRAVHTIAEFATWRAASARLVEFPRSCLGRNPSHRTLEGSYALRSNAEGGLWGRVAIG